MKSNNFEIKLFFPGNFFFDTEPCAAGQARLIQNFDRVTKKFTTKLRCIPHASVQWHALCPICEFFVQKLFEFKSQYETCSLSYESSFWHDFILSKFIDILKISGQISLKPATVYGSANSILREQRTKSQSFKVEQKI